MMIELTPGWVEVSRGNKISRIDPDEYSVLLFEDDKAVWHQVLRGMVAKAFDVSPEEISMSELITLDNALGPIVTERTEARKKKLDSNASLPDSTPASPPTSAPGASST